jgi:hypothetical protein
MIADAEPAIASEDIKSARNTPWPSIKGMPLRNHDVG